VIKGANELVAIAHQEQIARQEDLIQKLKDEIKRLKSMPPAEATLTIQGIGKVSVHVTDDQAKNGLIAHVGVEAIINYCQREGLIE
jgi:hypothetical protein